MGLFYYTDLHTLIDLFSTGSILFLLLEMKCQCFIAMSQHVICKFIRSNNELKNSKKEAILKN